MKNLTLLISMAMLLTGCATTEWVHPTKSKEVFYQEKLTCEELANRLAWQRYPQQAPSTKINTTVQVSQSDSTQSQETTASQEPADPYAYTRDNYQRETLYDCLYSKGWSRQKVER